MIPISKPMIGEEEKRAVLEVLDSGILAQGPRVAALEEAFRGVVGTKHAVATSSGTTALHLALLANGVGPGDEVITSPFTFIASVNAILYAGARPVFCDVDATTYNLDPGLLARLVSKRTKAVMPVHLYGQPCDMSAIGRVAQDHRLAVVEDAAQAIGATFEDRPVGSFGTGCFSLYATKNVMSGEGGMITTDDDAVAERARCLRQHGMRRRYYHDMLGYNFRMTDLCAAIGVEQMRRLAGFTRARQRNAAFLSEGLKSVRLPACGPRRTHVWHQYTVCIEDGAARRDDAVKTLAANGVECGIFYPVPAHRQAHIRELGLGNVRLPVAERLSEQVFSLPVHPLLGEEDLKTIVREVNKL